MMDELLTGKVELHVEMNIGKCSGVCRVKYKAWRDCMTNFMGHAESSREKSCSFSKRQEL